MFTTRFWEQAVRADAPRLQYVKCLDGFRGVGVALVLLEHYSNDRIPIGMPALTMFFVMSGYLITTLLIDEHRATGRVDGRDYTERRAIRLLPALWVFLAINMIIGLVGFFDLKNITIETVANLFYLYPVSYLWLHGAKSLVRMPQLWSLSFEAWFYLIWFFVMRSYLSKPAEKMAKLVRNITIFMVIQAVLTTLATFALQGEGLITIPPLAILYGVSLAYYRRGYLDRASRDEVSAREDFLLRWSSPVAFFVTFLFQIFAATSWRGDFPLKAMSMVSAPFIIGGLVMGKSPWIRWLLERKPLVWLGQISYAMYLYHFMLFFILEHNDPQPGGSPTSLPFWQTYLILFPATVLCGWLSQVLVERPAVKWFNRYTKRKKLAASTPSPSTT